MTRPGWRSGPASRGPTCAWSWSTTTAAGSSRGWSRRRSPGSFERLFGTPHGASIEQLAAAFGVPYTLVEQPGELAKAVSGTGLRIVEARTDRAANAELRARMRGGSHAGRGAGRQPVTCQLNVADAVAPAPFFTVTVAR